MKIHIIGAGLAGCEAAFQAARLGASVILYEQKPTKFSPAHSDKNFAELVCSNSFRAEGLANAVGLLKEEMRRFGSVVMQAADKTRVPAGGALAVDRLGFSQEVVRLLQAMPNIEIVHGEVTEIPKDGIVIIASGPLTEGRLVGEIARLTGSEYLSFYDAVAPIIEKDSIDMSNAYYGSRYGKGSGDEYINCPMSREEYEVFYRELIAAEEAEVHDFEATSAAHYQKDVNNELPDSQDGLRKAATIKVFEGCMPVETMAKRGEKTLLFGPLKPVGLPNPHDNGKLPHAVVQLRQDNAAATLYNMVGFQTHLKWGEQKRVFSLIPALCNAEFVRFGVMHRNTFINSPKLLNETYALKKNPSRLFAGQITGVEGYVESASSGLVAGVNAGLMALGREPLVFGESTAIGSLARYVSTDNADFQPMNINFGIMPPLAERIRGKKEKNEKISARALDCLEKISFQLFPR